LSDLVSVGALTRTFPPGLVDDVIAEVGRTERRHRSLPARVMAYFAIGMALHSEGSYEDVLGLLTDGLAWSANEEPVKLPSKSAIFQARARSGADPVRVLFERVARPLAGPDAPGCWLAGRRLVAIDGTCLDVADTVGNDEWFGRPGVMKGERAAFPQARVVAVAECGTHVVFDATVGPYTTSPAMSRPSPTGRGWLSYARPALVSTSTRTSSGWSITTSTTAGRTTKATSCSPRSSIPTTRPRSILPSGMRSVGRSSRCLMSSRFTSADLGPVLRSKSPELVLQEIWGHLCCHFAIRTLMWEAAGHTHVDPDRVSFVAALRIARHSISGARAFSP
jgi:hypothetical protein